MKLKIGNRAPDFELRSTGGTTFRLAERPGDKTLILYFYPKDFTMGCTSEACGFRDELARSTYNDFAVFGISTDSIETHEKFKMEYGLPFDLLSDRDGKVCRLYGVYNRLFRIANRVTFIIETDGTISNITRNIFAPGAHVGAMKSKIKA